MLAFLHILHILCTCLHRYADSETYALDHCIFCIFFAYFKAFLHMCAYFASRTRTLALSKLWPASDLRFAD